MCPEATQATNALLKKVLAAVDAGSKIIKRPYTQIHAIRLLKQPNTRRYTVIHGDGFFRCQLAFGSLGLARLGNAASTTDPLLKLRLRKLNQPQTSLRYHKPISTFALLRLLARRASPKV